MNNSETRDEEESIMEVGGEVALGEANERLPPACTSQREEISIVEESCLATSDNQPSSPESNATGITKGETDKRSTLVTPSLVKDKGSGSSRSSRTVYSLILGILVVYALTLSALTLWLFPSFFRLQDQKGQLERQVEDLELQASLMESLRANLTGQVALLAEQVETLQSDGNVTVREFEGRIHHLQDSLSFLNATLQQQQSHQATEQQRFVDEILNLTNSKETIISNLRQLRDEFQSCKEQKVQLQSDVQEQRDENSNLQSEVTILRDVRQNLTNYVTRLEFDLHTMQRLHKELGRSRDDLQSKVYHLNNTVDTLNANVTSLSEQVTNITNDKTVLEGHYHNVTYANEQCENQLEKTYKEFEDFREEQGSQMELLERNVTSLELELDRLDMVRTNLTQQVDALTKTKDDLVAANVDLELNVDRLENTTDRLSTEITKLERNNDAYAELNANLTRNNEEFAHQNSQLTKTSERFQELNHQLANENDILASLNRDLNATNRALSRLNNQLNSTVHILVGEVDTLENITDSLKGENAEFEELNGMLRKQINTLVQTNSDLSADLESLREEVTSLEAENDRFQVLNSDLTAIVSFLNNTAKGMDDSLESISKFLAKEIRVNRRVLLETMHNLYLHRTSNWECAFRANFSQKPFGRNFGAVIDTRKDYNAVLEYVDSWVLSRVCVDRADFEEYLSALVAEENGQDSSTTTVVSTTVNQVRRAVASYTLAALDYYFPDDGEIGLDAATWMEAQYRCGNLPPNQRFRYSP